MATNTTVFQSNTFDTDTAVDMSGNTTTSVNLTERFAADDKLFSRVYVNRYGIVTGGRFAEDAGLPPDPEFTGHIGLRVPAGTTDQRPTKGTAIIRYNTDLNAFEVYEAGAWTQPFEATNFGAVTTSILPAVQSSEIFQIDVGNESIPFRSGQFGRLGLSRKSVLVGSDTADGVLANYNNILYWCGQPIVTNKRKDVKNSTLSINASIPTDWLNSYVRITATTAMILIVPNGLGTPGDTIELVQASISAFTLNADTAVTINSTYTTLKPRAQFSKIIITCVANNTWDISGDLTTGS